MLIHTNRLRRARKGTLSGLRASSRVLSLAASAVVLASVVAGCSTARVPVAAKHVGVASASAGRAARVVTEKVCVDATTSSVLSFAPGVVRDLEAAVAEWAPPPPPRSPSKAVAARPGLDLYLRQVTTHSFATSRPAPELVIPATPYLAAPPGIYDPSLATDQVAWAAKERRWASAVTAAHAAAVAAVATLRKFRLDQLPSNMSAISGCLAALAGEGVQNRSVRMLLASDLEENEPAVTADYAGASILIDQSCPVNIESSCRALAGSWTARLRAQGAGRVAIVRADAAAAAIESWVLGGRA